MDSNNCSNDSEFVREFIQQLHEKNNMAMIPAAVLLTIFSVVGLSGNIMVLLVYSKKMQLSPTKVLIMAIATFDVVANVGAIPSEIYTMMNSMTFSQPNFCKVKVFVGCYTTVGDALSLCVLAAVRYRKVCRPHGWQFTIRHAVISSVLVAIVAFLFTVPYQIIFGVRTTNTSCPNIKGHECFTSDYYIYTKWPLYNNILFVLLYLAMAVSIVVLCSLIGNMAWKHSKLHGISAAVPVATQNTHSSSQGLSSSDNEPIASLDKETKPQTQNWPSRIKSEVVRRANLNILYCCRGKRGEEKTEEEAPSSTNNRSNTATSDTDTENKTSESTLSDLDEAASGERSKPHFGASARNSLDFVELKGGKLAAICEKPEDFQRNESTRNSSGHRAQSYYLALSEENQYKKKEQDLPKKSPLVAPNKTKSAPIVKGRVNRRRLGRMTAMLIIISTIFVLSFLPFLSLSAVKNLLPQTYAKLDMVGLSLFNLFYRSYFVNSAVNPIVYSFCDLNFRRECHRMLSCKRRKYM